MVFCSKEDAEAELCILKKPRENDYFKNITERIFFFFFLSMKTLTQKLIQNLKIKLCCTDEIFCKRLGDIIIIIISLTSSYIIYGKNTDQWSVCHPIIIIVFMYLASIKRTKPNHSNKSVQITQT